MDNKVKITTEYIKLDQLLKFSGAVDTGADAKPPIAEGKVTVNGEVCTMRGKKLCVGDKVGFKNEIIEIV